MAINLTRGDSRPLLIGLAVAALLGWGLYIYAEVSKAENQRGARREISALVANEETLKNQLAQQQQAAGTLADLQNQIAAFTNQSNQARTASDRAQAQLALIQKDLESQRQQQVQVAQQLQDQLQQLSQARAQTQEAEQRFNAARSETESLEQAKGARSQELAEVGKRLEAARQQETQAREDLARIAQEAAAKTANVAQAEQRIQQAREGEASLQQQLAAARGQMEEMAQQRT
jgi:chromosome segregation ATPase